MSKILSAEKFSNIFCYKLRVSKYNSVAIICVSIHWDKINLQELNEILSCLIKLREIPEGC